MSDETPERSAADFLPDGDDLASLAAAAKSCRGCDLWERATQTVFGEGGEHRPLMLVGEQPGDHEDLEGRPFVGPAGRLLDDALERAGIDRDATYVTNAVKHFSWTPRGKRRIHQRPTRSEISACGPWLEAEIRAVDPMVIVALGATAAQALIGSDVRVLRDRGLVLEGQWHARVLVTVHPSSILRSIDAASRAHDLELFVEDLRVAARLLRQGSSGDEHPTTRPKGQGGLQKK